MWVTLRIILFQILNLIRRQGRCTASSLGPVWYRTKDLMTMDLKFWTWHCRTDFSHSQAAEVDLHNMNMFTAKAALIVWLRFVKFHLKKSGTLQPFGPDRRHAFIVTGGPA